MKTIKIANVGKLVLRLVQTERGFSGVIIGSDNALKGRIDGDDRDDVWTRLWDAAAKVDPSYIGHHGARNRFLRFFPDGLQSPDFAREEREYKVAAKSRLDQTVPLTEAAIESGFGEAVLSVFGATTLLSPFEKMRLQDVLRGPTADAFVRAAARFAMGETAALRDMERALKPHDSAKWTAVT